MNNTQPLIGCQEKTAAYFDAQKPENVFIRQISHIIKAFEAKQEIYFEEVLHYPSSEELIFKDLHFTYRFCISDICYDILTRQPKGLIIEWKRATSEWDAFGNYNMTIPYCYYAAGLMYPQY